MGARAAGDDAYCRLINVEEILDELRRLGEPKRIAGLRRSGIASPALGVSVPVLRRVARDIGHDHDLALALWPPPLRETRILASLIDEPERVTAAQMDRWAQTFDSWEICDQCCQNLFWRPPFSLVKAGEWRQRTEEFVKRAGLVLVAVRAVHDTESEDETFGALIPQLIAAADDERLYVRKGGGWALRQIGKRNDVLRRRVLSAVSDMGSGSSAARWVARDVTRELRARPGAGPSVRA
jgi:3-methyladenine DNA glycosylase AlkD